MPDEPISVPNGQARPLKWISNYDGRFKGLIPRQALAEPDMALHVAGARRRRGQLIGGSQGRSLVVEADAWMTAERIKDPEPMTAMLCPGIWEAAE